jgi:hypothetical protein
MFSEGGGTGRMLAAKDKSIAAAKFDGDGRELEYRIQGIPGLVLVALRPRKDGRSSRIWRVYYSRTNGNGRTIRKVRLGPYPTVGLAEARRRAAELMADFLLLGRRLPGRSARGRREDRR